MSYAIDSSSGLPSDAMMLPVSDDGVLLRTLYSVSMADTMHDVTLANRDQN